MRLNLFVDYLLSRSLSLSLSLSRSLSLSLPPSLEHICDYAEKNENKIIESILQIHFEILQVYHQIKLQAQIFCITKMNSTIETFYSWIFILYLTKVCYQNW
jgi:hypothetical protein